MTYNLTPAGRSARAAPWTCPICNRTMRVAGKGPHTLVCGRDYWPVFMAKVEKTEQCWLWTGALQRDGYAHFTNNQKTISAHRYAYEKLVGPIPDGMDLLHSCDVRHCVKPAHLRPGTHQENIEEMKLKGRSGVAVLTLEQASAVKKMLGTMTQRDIAKRFGVGEGVISNIKRGKAYGHVQ